MIGNFKVEIEDVEFSFITQHTVKLYGFQVYAPFEGKQIRFHMQVTDIGTFRITDPQACPVPYFSWEKLLSQAVLNYGESLVNKIG